MGKIFLDVRDEKNDYQFVDVVGLIFYLLNALLQKSATNFYKIFFSLIPLGNLWEVVSDNFPTFAFVWVLKLKGNLISKWSYDKKKSFKKIYSLLVQNEEIVINWLAL